MSRRICVDLYNALVALPAVARSLRRQGRDQDRDDRLGGRPAGMAAAHPQQAAPRVETAQVIEELLGLAKEMNEANRRGEKLGFCDALETNDSAVQVLGEPTLKEIAQELVASVRRNVSIDWTVRESVRAKMRASQAHPVQTRLPVR